MAEWHSSIEGPRWAGIPRFLAECAGATGVKLSWSIDKSFLRTLVVFTVTGEEDAVDAFRAYLSAGISAYQLSQPT